MRLFLALLPALFLSCAAPSRPANPALSSNQVRADLFTQEVRLHRFSAKNSRIPDPAFSRALATIERHLGQPIRVIDHGEMDAGWGENGPIAPIQSRGHPISSADVAAANGRFLLPEPDNGILGVIDRRMIPGEEATPALMLPLVEPGTIIVVELPGPDNGAGITGYVPPVCVASGQAIDVRTGAVVLFRSAIHHRSNLFVSESKMAQWTLTHELGHVLGVPESNTHIWSVPGLGAHCTYPECVMYTGLDWRVVVTGLLKGWPLDFCAQCSAELARAKSAARQK